MAMRGGGEVKVVIINTQYVETDAGSFKSVVQRLTGKDAVVAAATAHSGDGGGGSGSGRAAPVMERMISFKDFDRMLKELPPLNELYGLYADF